MISEPLICFLYFLITVVLCIGLGTLLLSVVPKFIGQKNNFTFLFLALFFGLTLVSITTAILIAKFKTILVLGLPGFCYLFYVLTKNKRQIQINWIYSNPFKLIILSILLVFSFLIKFSNQYNYSTNSYKSPNPDYILYSLVSNTLIENGNENTYLAANFIIPISEGVSPYHFTLLWLNGLIASTYDITFLNSLVNIVYPMLFFCFLLALLSLCEIFSPIRIKTLLIALLVLFVSGIYFNEYLNIPFLSLTGVFCKNMLSVLGDKYGYVYCFIILSLLVWHYFGIQESLVVWLMIPMNFAVTVPGIFLSFPIFIFLFRKQIQDLTGIISFGVFNIIGYFGFYIICGTNIGQSLDLSFSLEDSFTKFLNFSNLKTAFNVIVGTLIHLFLVYFPFLLLMILFFGKNIKSLIFNPLSIFIALTFCFGLITWAVFFEIIDMVQMVNGCGILFLNCFLIFLILESLHFRWELITGVRKFSICFITSLIIVLQLCSNYFMSEFKNTQFYSTNYSNNVISEVNKNPKNKRIYIANITENFHGIFDYLSYHIISSHFLYSQKNIIPVCIDNFEFEKDKFPDYQKKEIIRIVESGYLFQFVRHQKKSGTYISLEHSRMNVLDSLKINYLSISNGSHISNLLLTNFKLVAKDKLSGESFYVRKSKL